jgi:hypothetical protein
MHTKTILGLALLSVASVSVGVAAPPGGGGAPPLFDIAYMNVTSSVWGEPNTAAVRGLQVDPAGTASGDASLWKGSSVYHRSMTWNPDGTWLAWAQYIDKKGTRAIVAGKPGSGLTTVLTFPNGDITRRNGTDNLAWGRGCNGRSVIVFLGDQLYDYLDALYVFDPFVVGAQASRLYVIKHGPQGSPDRGQGIAFSPQGQHLAFVEQDDTGFNHVVALPLTCLPGDSLPTAAGSPLRLFPVQSDAGVDGGRAGTVGLDWSPDGHRLAASVGPLLVWQPGYRSWGVARIHVGELAYSVSGGVEQVSAAELGMHAVTSGPAAGQEDHTDELPSWGPASATAACDRLVFSRSGALMLLEAPRNGFTPDDCTVPEPTTISSKLISGLDWR